MKSLFSHVQSVLVSRKAGSKVVRPKKDVEIRAKPHENKQPNIGMIISPIKIQFVFFIDDFSILIF